MSEALKFADWDTPMRLAAIVYDASTRLGAISPDQAAEKSAPDSWSPKEELGHLIDSATVNHQRIVRTILEDNPALPSYDGDRWVALHEYQSGHWMEMIKLWLGVNEHIFAVIDTITNDLWARTCTVGDSETMTLKALVESYIDHMLDHLRHIGIETEGLGEDHSEKREIYPEKPASTGYLINDLISRRWSPRAFDEGKKLTPHLVRTLIDAASWAPSCYNEQPWRYLIFDGSDKDAMERARACLVEGNAWARKAPVLMLSVAKETFTRDGKPNRTAHHDVGLASENLVLEAVEYGMVAHQMAGFDVERARREFSIPDGYTPLAMIAIGYPHHGSTDDLPEDIRKKELAPRSRKYHSEIAFAGKWGRPY
ncbi:MAG: nitroreductase family protein [Acidobacteriota bacterium]